MIVAPRVALGAAAGLVVLAVAAEAVSGAPEPSKPTRVAVTQADLVCPGVLVDATAGSKVRTLVSYAAPEGLAEGAEGLPDGGSIQVGTLADPDALVARTERRGAVAEARESALHTVTADGALAAGVAAEEFTVSGRTADHGISGVDCREPVSEAWFVGAGSEVGRTTVVHLDNPEETSATVTIDVYARNGLVDTPATQGVVVEPRSSRTISLTEAAPGAGDVALHVVAASGRIGVGVREREVRGLTARGVDWLPSSQAPAQRVVVPGLLVGEGSRELTLFAPGTGTATVEVGAVGVGGRFVPTGGGPVDIDRGRVTTVDIGKGLADDDTAVVIDSPVPLVAGVRWALPGDVSDFAFSAGSPALSGPAVVTGLDRDLATPEIMLTAPDGAADVELQELVAGKRRGDPRTVTVAAGTTLKVRASDTSTGRFALLITPKPGSGPVYGGLVRVKPVEGFGGVTISPIAPVRAAVDVPVARQDLGVVVGE